MARALAAVVSAGLLTLGSVAVSGVSATAAPAASDQTTERAQSVETDAVSVERVETHSVRYLHWSHHNEGREQSRDRHEDLGDIHLGADFFVGGGGVGADPAFDPSGGGGAFAQAGASASASASARGHAHGGSHGGGHRR